MNETLAINFSVEYTDTHTKTLWSCGDYSGAIGKPHTLVSHETTRLEFWGDIAMMALALRSVDISCSLTFESDVSATLHIPAGNLRRAVALFAAL